MGRRTFRAKKKGAELVRELSAIKPAIPIPPPSMEGRRLMTLAGDVSDEHRTVDEAVLGLGYGIVHWVNGAKSDKDKPRVEAENPPCNGAQSAFVVDKGGRSVVLVCPFSLRSFVVTRRSSEFRSLKPTRDGFDREKIGPIMLANWKQYAEWGWMVDYDAVASVFRLLRMDIPTYSVSVKEGEEHKPRGGKEVAAAVLKPVKRESRPGQVLTFFLADEGRPRSLREAMAEFDITRSNLLSQLYLLNTKHGVGYTLVGEAAQVTLPKGDVWAS